MRNLEKNKQQCKAWYEANRARKIKHYREWAEKNIQHLLFMNAKRRAAKLGMSFNITVKDCVIPVKCPVFGIKLRMGVGCSNYASPTLDRVNSRRGYVKGNVAVISQFANSLKGAASASQHRRIAWWMDSHARN